MWLLALAWSATISVYAVPVLQTAAHADIRSARGVVVEAKTNSITLRVDGHSRTYVFDKKTTLVDQRDQIIAVGGKAIGPRVASSGTVLISYKVEWVTDGAGAVTAEYYRAVEVRVLPTGA